MAGYVVLGNNKYIGTLTASEDNIYNGAFVVPNLANGTAGLPNDDATGDVWFVENEIDTVPEEGINDVDFNVDTGDYLRLHVPQSGEILITDQIGSLYANISVGDQLGVGDDGKLELVADLTAVDLSGFKYTFTVKEKCTLWGNNALKVVVD